MKIPVRVLLVLMCAALIVSIPFFLSSPTMLSEAQEELVDNQKDDDDGVELDFGRLFVSVATAEENLTIEDLEEDGKLSIPDERALPMDFSLAPAPDPDHFTENGYEDQSIRVRIEQKEMYNSKVNVAYVEIADASQLRTATAGPLSAKKAHYVETIARNNHAVIAMNGDDYIKTDNSKEKSFEVRMAQVVTQDHKRNKAYKLYDTLVIDNKGNFHLFPLSEGLMDYVSQNKDDIVQALTFGPSLVIDGEIQDLEKRKSVYAGTHKNPRSAIGQTGPLSYVMVIVEAKKRGDGTGVTHTELAQIMLDLGCKQAFNLDGGNSAEMIIPGPDQDNAAFHCKGDNSANVRPQSDIIFFATAVPEEERK